MLEGCLVIMFLLGVASLPHLYSFCSISQSSERRDKIERGGSSCQVASPKASGITLIQWNCSETAKAGINEDRVVGRGRRAAIVACRDLFEGKIRQNILIFRK